MTGPRAPTRSRHGRIVLVGEAGKDGTGSAGEMKGRAVVRADNLFDAVGEVTVSSAADPVEAIVVPAAVVRRTAAVAVEAFRRIDPSVRLILLAESRDEAAALRDASAGFDDVLVGPLAPSELARVLDSDNGAAQHAAPRADKGVIEVPAVAPGMLQAPSQERRPPAAPHDSLGDTDLVEAILNDPQGAAELAMELMRQQTGWSDLALGTDPPEADGVATVEVRFGERSSGVLSSAQARAAQLRPWAEWLGRWLALDRGYRDYRQMAFQDDLTGAWNRRFYGVFMKRTLREAARSRRAVTVLVFDIDDFKHYNDEFGHEAGDEILRETVRLLNSVIRAGDRVCRMGGDEFAVVFAPQGPREVGSNPPEAVETIATRFQDQICKMKFPKLGLDAPGTLSVSGGLATYPWDGTDAESLLRHADRLALQSKKKGKNVITLGRGSAHRP